MNYRNILSKREFMPSSDIKVESRLKTITFWHSLRNIRMNDKMLTKGNTRVTRQQRKMSRMQSQITVED